MDKIKRSVLAICGWSVASCGLTLAVFMPANLHATSPVAKTEITQPKLVSGGVELTMRVLDESRIELTALNQSDQPTVMRGKFECQSFDTSDRMSRVPRPNTAWTHEESIALGPNETKRIMLPATLKLEAGNWITATTEAQKDAVVLLTSQNDAVPLFKSMKTAQR